MAALARPPTAQLPPANKRWLVYSVYFLVLSQQDIGEVPAAYLGVIIISSPTIKKS